MKKILLTIIVLLVLITYNAKAEQKKITCWACHTEEYLNDISRYISNSDNNAMYRYIISGKCTLIDDYVYVVDWGFLVSRIDWSGEKWYVISECVR